MRARSFLLEQSFCILMTDFKLSTDARERIQTMVRTNNERQLIPGTPVPTALHVLSAALARVETEYRVPLPGGAVRVVEDELQQVADRGGGHQARARRKVVGH